jgi:hypothetical protein
MAVGSNFIRLRCAYHTEGTEHLLRVNADTTSSDVSGGELNG